MQQDLEHIKEECTKMCGTPVVCLVSSNILLLSIFAYVKEICSQIA